MQDGGTGGRHENPESRFLVDLEPRAAASALDVAVRRVAVLDELIADLAETAGYDAEGVAAWRAGGAGPSVTLVPVAGLEGGAALAVQFVACDVEKVMSTQ